MIKYQCDNCGKGFVPLTKKSNRIVLYRPTTVGDNYPTEKEIEYALCTKCLKKLNKILKNSKKNIEEFNDDKNNKR